MTPYYEHAGITIYHGDCLEVLNEIPSFDLVITSPPYNLGSAPWEHLGHWKQGDSAGGKSKWKNGSDAGAGIQYGAHVDAIPWPEYLEQQNDVISALWRRLTPAGAIFYNHKPRVVGGRLWLPTALVPIEAELRQIVIWARPGGMNFKPTAFVPTHEWLMILARPDFRLKSKGVSGLGDVWTMTPDRNAHPAPFPLKLPSRVLESVNADLVVDPYAGSGTTLVAAKAHGRRAIGIEIDERFCEMAAKRLSQEVLPLEAAV